MTHVELRDAVGVSQRAIAYYETDAGAMLVDAIRALKISSDGCWAVDARKEKPVAA